MGIRSIDAHDQRAGTDAEYRLEAGVEQHDLMTLGDIVADRSYLVFIARQFTLPQRVELWVRDTVAADTTDYFTIRVARYRDDGNRLQLGTFSTDSKGLKAQAWTTLWTSANDEVEMGSEWLIELKFVATGSPAIEAVTCKTTYKRKVL